MSTKPQGRGGYNHAYFERRMADRTVGGRLGWSFFWGGCRLEDNAGLENQAAEPTVAPHLTLLATDIVPRTRADSAALTREVARALALAMADSSIRLQIWSALRTSRMREKKLHLQRFLISRGAPLGAAIEARVALSPGRLNQAIAKLPDLEVYLPHPAHRSAWLGTDNLVVLGTNEPESATRGARVLAASDLHGNNVWVSTANPPDHPVMVVRLAESRFGPDGEGPPGGPFATECPPEVSHCDGEPPPPSDPCSLTPYGTSLRVCKVWIHNIGQYEGWLAGAPEISALLFSVLPDGTAEVKLGCANEDQSGLQFYNQDNDVWQNVGQFRIGDSAAIASANASGRRVAMMLWEDDVGSKCDLHTWSDDERLILRRLFEATILTGYSWVGCENNCWPWPVYLSLMTVNAVVTWIAQLADDQIGVASVASGAPQGGQMMKWVLRGSAADSVGVVWAVTRP